MRCRLALLAVIPLVFAACESTSAPPAAPSAPAPSAPAPVTASASATPSPPAASATSCLPTHICGCNLGCARVAVDAASLRDGMHVTPQTGAYSGKEMTVMKETDASGASVFALSDREHTSACERETPESRSLLGFACAAKDSGPVPARACAKGCD